MEKTEEMKTDLERILERLTKVKGKRFVTALKKILDNHKHAHGFVLRNCILMAELEEVKNTGKAIPNYFKSKSRIYVEINTNHYFIFHHIETKSE